MKFSKLFMFCLAALSFAVTACDKSGNDSDNGGSADNNFYITQPDPKTLTGNTASVTVIPKDNNLTYIVGIGPVDELVAYGNRYDNMLLQYCLPAIRNKIADGKSSWQTEIRKGQAAVQFSPLEPNTEYYVLAAGVEFDGSDVVRLITGADHIKFTTTDEIYFDGYHIAADHRGDMSIDNFDEVYITLSDPTYDEESHNTVTVQFSDKKNLKMCMVEFFVSPDKGENIAGTYAVPEDVKPRFTDGYVLIGMIDPMGIMGSFFGHMQSDGNIRETNTVYGGSLTVGRGEDGLWSFSADFRDYDDNAITFEYSGEAQFEDQRKKQE